jgi:hypothetical protein
MEVEEYTCQLMSLSGAKSGVEVGEERTESETLAKVPRRQLMLIYSLHLAEAYVSLPVSAFFFLLLGLASDGCLLKM